MWPTKKNKISNRKPPRHPLSECITRDPSVKPRSNPPTRGHFQFPYSHPIPSPFPNTIHIQTHTHTRQIYIRFKSGTYFQLIMHGPKSYPVKRFHVIISGAPDLKPGFQSGLVTRTMGSFGALAFLTSISPT